MPLSEMPVFLQNAFTPSLYYSLNPSVLISRSFDQVKRDTISTSHLNGLNMGTQAQQLDANPVCALVGLTVC